MKKTIFATLMALVTLCHSIAMDGIEALRTDRKETLTAFNGILAFQRDNPRGNSGNILIEEAEKLSISIGIQEKIQSFKDLASNIIDQKLSYGNARETFLALKQEKNKINSRAKALKSYIHDYERVKEENKTPEAQATLCFLYNTLDIKLYFLSIAFRDCQKNMA